MFSVQRLRPYLSKAAFAFSILPLTCLIACQAPNAYSVGQQTQSKSALAAFSHGDAPHPPDYPIPSAQPLTVASSPTSEFYDRATLEYWQDRYSRSSQRILDEGLIPTLSASELQALDGVRLDFPLQSGSPMGFYASSPPPVITMPADSLKFLDDLCVAYAWLWANGYRLETVEEYVAMLRYKPLQDFPGGRYPTPFEALGIPANALDDSKVDDLSLRFFNSARAFILAHELAHIRYQHPGGVVQDEMQADRFALEVLSRTGTIPMGIILYFQAMAHWLPNRAQFGSDAAWRQFLQESRTHPLTAERIQAIANTLNQMAPEFVAPTETNPATAIETVRFIAVSLQELVDYLEDPEMQLCVGEMAANADPTSLRPRSGGTSLLDC